MSKQPRPNQKTPKRKGNPANVVAVIGLCRMLLTALLANQIGKGLFMVRGMTVPASWK